MNTLLASLAALAIAFVGMAGAGSASAKPIQAKPLIHLCKPHYETHTQYLGIRHIGYRFYRVYRIETDFVNVLCRKHTVRVNYRYVPVPFYFQKKGHVA